MYSTRRTAARAKFSISFIVTSWLIADYLFYVIRNRCDDWFDNFVKAFHCGLPCLGFILVVEVIGEFGNSSDEYSNWVHSDSFVRVYRVAREFPEH